MKKNIIAFCVILFILETFLMSALQIEVDATIPPNRLVEKVQDVFSGPEKCMMYLMEDGTLFAGGTPIYEGQLGTLQTSGKLPSASQVNLTNVLGKVKKVEIGYNFSMLLDDKGYVYTTGRNNSGQLGISEVKVSTSSKLTVFTRVPLPEGVFIKDITAGAETAYALASNGNLYGWGSGAEGSLSQGSSKDIDSLPIIIAIDVVQASASKSDGSWDTKTDNGIYIVKEDGNLYVCGPNYRERLGTGKDLTTFTNVPFFNDLEIEQIQAGNAKAFVLLKDGTAYAVGTNYYGGLGVNGSDITGKTPALKTGKGNVTTWSPIVIPNGYVIEKLFRCSTSQMFQLRNLQTGHSQIWGSGRNQSGDMGFYSEENTWNPSTSTREEKYLLTNIATLQQTDVHGNIVQLSPTSSGDQTDIHIYDNGPIKALSGNWDTTYIVDADGYLRIAGDNAHTYSSLSRYSGETNTSKRQFYRTQQSTSRSILDPVIEILDYQSTATLPISGINTQVPVNPSTIILGPKQSDENVPVYEKYTIYNIMNGSNKSYSDLVSNGPINLKVKDLNLTPGDYLIEVSREATTAKLTSNSITKIFKITETVTLSYDSNTGTGSPPADPVQYGKESNVTILNNTYTKVGHKFVNWNTSSNGSGTSYNPGDEIKLQNNTTLYAQWTPLFPMFKEKDGIFITAKNFILDISDIDETNSVEESKLKTESEVDAWELSSGDSIGSEITVNHSIEKKVGRYPVTFSVRGVDLEVYAYIKDDNNYTIDETQNILIIGKGFTIDTKTAKTITNEAIIDKSGAKAWNLTTNDPLDLNLDRSSLNADSGIGPHEVTFSVDNVSHKIIISVIDDSNTTIENNTAIYGKSFIIDQGVTLTDPDILSMSDAKAWSLSGDLYQTSQIEVNRGNLDTSSIGWYEVTLSIDSVVRKIVVSVIDLTDTTVDEANDTIIYAKDFSVALNDYDLINREYILNKSDAKAWRISVGGDLINQIQVDSSNLKKVVEKYDVDLNLNGATRKIKVNISASDITLPEITNITAITPSGYNGKWTNQDITLLIEAHDNKGIDKETFEISYDGKVWKDSDFKEKTESNANDANAKVTISKEGRDQNIYIRVSDTSGNTSVDVNVFDHVKINIDKTDPKTNYAEEDEPYVFEDLEAITFSDDLSGISSATLNGENILPSGSSFPKVGTNELEIKDNAGNTTKITFTVKNYNNKIEISGTLLDKEDLTRDIAETSVILRNTQSNREYIGFLKYDTNEKLIFKNIEYGDYTIFCINPADIEFNKTSIPGINFTFEPKNPNIEFTITSNFINLQGFGNIKEENNLK